MKTTFDLENLDCANCAAKMEAAVQKLDGIASARVSFLTQKMTLETDAVLSDDLLKKVVKICRRIEPDCKIKL
ncbi:MAG TPA: heavy-metal-associated domain-containing protein [Candidatus Fimenecus excrementigallinarum]|uniref:Heavy-metal-associated domain-containing protein n=1 Tax=Candidatus Fimenecus excrementigallinarum TaxID=2840816 RepID=A0A9D1II21_9FIRM|nr:heavy-metal-associated domain-containing protein [Candidatus Fimenecus excrementigallinarum]